MTGLAMDSHGGHGEFDNWIDSPRAIRWGGSVRRWGHVKKIVAALNGKTHRSAMPLDCLTERKNDLIKQNRKIHHVRSKDIPDDGHRNTWNPYVDVWRENLANLKPLLFQKNKRRFIRAPASISKRLGSWNEAKDCFLPLTRYSRSFRFVRMTPNLRLKLETCAPQIRAIK